MSWLSGWSEMERSVLSLSGEGSSGGEDFGSERHFVSFASQERTVGILAQKISNSHFDSISDTILARNVMALSQAGDLLSSLGPEIIPLKGLYLIDRFYKMGERDLGDLDLLIRRERVVEVVSFLEKEGYHPSVPLEKVFGGGGSYLNSVSLHQESCFPIHLHWHVINASLPLFMVRIPVEELWDESRSSLVAGAPVRALAPHHLLVTVAEHSLKHSYETLIHLVDIDRIVRSGVDLPRSFSCARRWGVEESLQIGLYLCSRMLGTPVEVGMPKGILARMIIHSVRKNRRWGGIGSLGYLSMAKGVRQKIRFLWGTFFPPSEEVHSFGKTSGLHRVLSRGWRAILGGRRLLGGKP